MWDPAVVDCHRLALNTVLDSLPRNLAPYLVRWKGILWLRSKAGACSFQGLWPSSRTLVANWVSIGESKNSVKAKRAQIRVWIYLILKKMRDKGEGKKGLFSGGRSLQLACHLMLDVAQRAARKWGSGPCLHEGEWCFGELILTTLEEDWEMMDWAHG